MQSDWEWTIRYFGWIHEDYMRFVRDLLTFLTLSNSKDLDERISSKLLTTNNGLKIELKNVSYSYPNTKFKVLQDINFTIYPGEKIALIGENGSGKSTLVKLISGLLEPSDGETRINGQIITSKSPLHKISVVFQDFSEYHMSVRENVGLGEPMKIDDINYIFKAIKKGGAMDFIEPWKKVLIRCSVRPLVAKIYLEDNGKE